MTKGPSPPPAVDASTLLGRSLSVPAMLSEHERLVIAYEANRLRKRHPTIVELGCYLGASTMSLVDGLLARRRKRPPRRPVIHSYDRFLADEFMVEHSLREHGVEPGGSFEHVFELMLGGARPLVEIHAGDIREERWTGGPIDLLFVDIIWGWDINQHVIEQFYVPLQPAATLIHQDFVYSFYPWLTSSMEWFVRRGVFEYQHYAPPSTVTFKMLRPLTDDEQRFSFTTDLSVAEQHQLVVEAADHFEGLAHQLIKLSLARLLTDAGAHDEAREAFHAVADHTDDPVVQHHVEMMRSWITGQGHPL